MSRSSEAAMSVTYYVVVVFDLDENGDLKAGEAREAASASAAERHARMLSGEHAGAVAFARTGDPASGEFADATILSRFGAVDLDALSA
jgi:hypothetical protein